jgi:hypothetical protein
VEDAICRLRLLCEVENSYEACSRLILIAMPADSPVQLHESRHRLGARIAVPLRQPNANLTSEPKGLAAHVLRILPRRNRPGEEVRGSSVVTSLQGKFGGCA